MQRVSRTFVDTFRMSSPYIHAHQGFIFVTPIPGELLQENLLSSVMEGVELMRGVGIKLVLVLGPQGFINERMNEAGVSSTFIDGTQVTDSHALQIVEELSGSMRF